MENKIPTVLEVAIQRGLYVEGNPVLSVEDAIDLIKLHVKAALEAASKNADGVAYMAGIDAEPNFRIYEDSILNAYPETNIV